MARGFSTNQAADGKYWPIRRLALKNRKYSLVFWNKFGGLSVLVLGWFCSWKEGPLRKVEYYQTKEFTN